MKKSTSILLICGGIFAGLLFLKNGKNGLDKLKQFLQDLANGLGDFSKSIWDSLKSFWDKFTNKNNSLSTPLLKNGVGGNPQNAPSIFEENKNVEVIGIYDNYTNQWIGEGYD